jgi:stage II sporulation protein D
MRCFAALLLLSELAWSSDLAGYFAGRTGAALVYDLQTERTVGEWYPERARTRGVRAGSTLKPFTLAAHIEAGQYRDTLKIPTPDGVFDARQALAYSSNEFFEALAKRMTTEDLERGYARFGLRYGASTVTLEALSQAMRRLAKRRHEVRLQPVFAGLRDAVEFGTARLAGTARTQVAGKTGTMKETALFVGYAPADKPRYVVAIHLDGGSGGGDAAPYAARIFGDLFQVVGGTEDPKQIQIRMFWQNPPRALNLAPGAYPKGTEVVAEGTRFRAPGTVRVDQKDGVFQVTVTCGLEDYVAAVLQGEAGGFRRMEGKKAMAVAARTYAARFRHRHADEGFDFCDTTHCQDARLLLAPREDLAEAVTATDGELLWFEGKPAAAYYHADSGGWLEGAGDAPYLKARRDPYWKDVPEARWNWKTTTTELAAALRLTLVRPVFRVTATEPSGRVRALDAFGHPAEAASFRMAVGRALGWEKLSSRMFTVTQRENVLEFAGVGRGHGIGMPQTSAERMAAEGADYRKILDTYYPGTRLGLTPAGMRWQTVKGSAVTLVTTDVTRDRALLGKAEGMLGELERLTGMKARPTVRIYPSREAFRDATGVAGNVAGITRGGHVRVAVGVNDGTLRHELLHAVLETNTRMAHPEWFREGLVLSLLREEGVERARVDALVAKHGRGRVLAFWREGLPTEALQGMGR